MLLLYLQCYQGEKNITLNFNIHLTAGTVTHANCLLSKAKDVAENTFLLALDSMNLSQYRSFLRYILILIFSNLYAMWEFQPSMKWNF